MSYIQFLSECELGRCPKFSISGCFLAKVVKVYDGDTITVTFDPRREITYRQKQKKYKKQKQKQKQKHQAYQFSVRMYGYDSEEIKQPKNKPNRDKLKKKATNARNVLRELILNDIVIIEVLPNDDKYGRLLGKVYQITHYLKKIMKGNKTKIRLDELTCINTFMVKNKYGKPYFGGTKAN